MMTKNLNLLQKIMFYFFSTLIALSIAMPFFWMLSTSLKPNGALMSLPVEWLPEKPTLDSYIKLLNVSNFTNSIFNSFYVAVLSTVVRLLSAAMAAYALTKIEFKGRETLFKLFLTTMMIPFQVIFIPLFIVLTKLGLSNNLTHCR